MATSIYINKLIDNIACGTASVAFTVTDVTAALGGKVLAPGKGLILEFANTSSAVATITVANGVNPPAFRSGMGDAGATAPATTKGGLTIVVPATTGKVRVQLEVARFAQANGSLLLSTTCDCSMAAVKVS